MRVIDASSLLHAWDNYPIENFPTLWDWLATQVSSRDMLLPRVAWEEVGHISQECRQWIDGIDGFSVTEVDNAVVSESLAINSLLGIQSDQYGSGVDANDVIIIATAKANGCGLISNEARQPSLPSDIKKYKIPAVCFLPAVGVDCKNFAELIRISGRVF